MKEALIVIAIILLVGGGMMFWNAKDAPQGVLWPNSDATLHIVNGKFDRQIPCSVGSVIVQYEGPNYECLSVNDFKRAQWPPIPLNYPNKPRAVNVPGRIAGPKFLVWSNAPVLGRVEGRVYCVSFAGENPLPPCSDFPDWELPLEGAIKCSDCVFADDPAFKVRVGPVSPYYTCAHRGGCVEVKPPTTGEHWITHTNDGWSPN